MPQLVAAQAFRWITDSDFGVINYLIDKLPGVNYQNHSWFVNPWQGWSVITTLVVWAGVPFLAITLNAGLTQVPKELVEAATVDGASPWQTLRNIILPILKPLLTIVTTLSVIWDFGLFTQNWALRDGHPEPVYQTLGDLLVHAGVRPVPVQPRLGHLGDHRAADARRDGVLHPADVQDRGGGLMVATTPAAPRRPQAPPDRRRRDDGRPQPGRHDRRQRRSA